MPLDLRVNVLISGRVQGVGFRYTTRFQARSQKLSGWVRNLSDGRVEAEFQGPKEAIDAMIAWCKIGPAAATVTEVDVQACDTLEQEADFSLRH